MTVSPLVEATDPSGIGPEFEPLLEPGLLAAFILTLYVLNSQNIDHDCF